jgi:hypothetical protein
MAKNTWKRTRPPRLTASTVKKSAATIVPKCALMNVLHELRFRRSGAGSIPCSAKSRRIVLRPTSWLRFASAPRMRV